MKAFALLIALLFTAGPAYAQPEVRNLQAFRALVPDYSRSSGGSEPALSSDGKTLAYTAGGRSIWILHSDDLMSGKGEAWRLKSVPESKAPGEPDSSNSRNLDWSPNGNRLVFSGNDGHLYLAENFDFEAKTADVRVLAKPKLYGGETSAKGIEAPRWSPDGKKIAFVRARRSNPSVLCVLDLDTGVETELYILACDGSRIWEQPWSPDSRQLVYATCVWQREPDGSATVFYSGIDVISIDGKDRRRIVEAHPYTPSWSPNSDQIVFTMVLGTTASTVNDAILNGKMVTVTHYAPITMVTDSRRSKCDFLYQYQIEQPKAVPSGLERKAMELAFEEEFSSKLTPEQQERLRQGKMTQNEMTTISAIITAREIDADFAKLLEQRLKAIPEGEKTEIWSDPVISKAVSELPEEKKTQFMSSSSKWYVTSLKATSHPGSDTLPVWSRDGQKVAFVRQDVWKDQSTLMMLDIKSAKLTPLFCAYEIANISWTSEGRILMQATHLTGSRRTGKGTENSPSYPEIWLLEPSPVN